MTSQDKVNMRVSKVQIGVSDDEKLLGITLDKKIKFKKHVKKLCKKANQMRHPPTSISIYMKLERLKLLMKSFIMSQFSYCLLIWMFHDRNLNNKTNKIHERAIRIAYKNNVSSFENLLLIDNSQIVQQRNLQLLMTDICKARNYLNLSSMAQISEKRYCLTT